MDFIQTKKIKMLNKKEGFSYINLSQIKTRLLCLKAELYSEKNRFFYEAFEKETILKTVLLIIKKNNSKYIFLNARSSLEYAYSLIVSAKEVGINPTWLTEKEIERILLETLKTNPDYIVIIDHMNPKCHLFLKLKNKVIIFNGSNEDFFKLYNKNRWLSATYFDIACLLNSIKKYHSKSDYNALVLNINNMSLDLFLKKFCLMLDHVYQGIYDGIYALSTIGSATISKESLTLINRYVDIAVLKKYRIIIKKDHLYLIHPLFQSMSMLTMCPINEKKVLKNIFELSLIQMSEKKESQCHCLSIMSLYPLINLLESNRLEDSQSYSLLISLLNQMIKFLLRYKKFQMATILSEKLLKNKVLLTHMKTEERGTLEATLAVAFQRSKKYKVANTVYKQCIEKLDKVMSKKTEFFIDHLSEYAESYKYIGQFENALHIHEKALSLRLDNGDELHISKSINNIGGVYHAKKDYKKALFYYKKALAIRERIANNNEVYRYRYVAYSANNIGEVYELIHHFKDAIVYFIKALDARSKVEEKEHPSLQNYLKSICLNYERLRDETNKNIYLAKLKKAHELVINVNSSTMNG